MHPSAAPANKSTKDKKAAIPQGTGAKTRKPSKAAKAESSSSKCVVGTIAFVVVASCMVAVIIVFGSEGPEYETSQVLFSGQLQFEELNDGYITNAREITSSDSAAGRNLVDNIKPKMIEAYDDEGILVEDIVFNTLYPTPPFSIRRNELVSPSAKDIPALIKGRAFNDKNFQYVEKQYNNIQYVNARYEVIATPSTNAAVVGSARQRHWPMMSDAVQASLASKGIKTRITSMDPSTKFLKAVQEQIKTVPATVVRHAPRKKQPVDCDCQAVASTYPVGSIVCKCPSGCHEQEGLNVLGGHDNVFSSFTHICKTAYYANVIPKQGGIVTLINIGEVDEVDAGPEKKGIVPDAVYWRENAVKIRVSGSIINPTTPSPIATTEAFVPTTTPGRFIPPTQGPAVFPTQGPGGIPPTQVPGGTPSTQGPGESPPTQGPGGIPPTQGPGGTPSTQGPGGTPSTQGPGGIPPTQGPGGSSTTQGPGGIPTVGPDGSSSLEPGGITQGPGGANPPAATPLTIEPLPSPATVGSFQPPPAGAESIGDRTSTPFPFPFLPSTTPPLEGGPTSRGSSGGFPSARPGGGLAPDLTVPPSDRRTTTKPPPPKMILFPPTEYDIPEKCLFTIIVRYRNFNYWMIHWARWLRERTHAKFVEFQGLLEQRWMDSATEMGFKLDEVMLVEVVNTPWNINGIGVRVCFKGNLATNAQVALKEEQEQRGTIPDRLLAGAANFRRKLSDDNVVDFAELYGFRYSSVFINEMNRIESR